MGPPAHRPLRAHQLQESLDPGVVDAQVGEFVPECDFRNGCLADVVGIDWMVLAELETEICPELAGTRYPPMQVARVMRLAGQPETV